MKATCPNCKKTFRARDEYAGRKVKCPHCKEGMTLPRAEQGPSNGEMGFDLGSLEAFEAGGVAVVRDEKRKPMTLKEAQAAAAAATQTEQPRQVKVDPTLRTCPGCGEKVRSEDLYADLICRHCGTAIPGVELNKKDEARYSMAPEESTSKVNFYTGFTGALFYPLPAIGSIGLGMVIALAAIATPLLPLIAFTGASSANEASKEQMDFGWVGVFLAVMFALEGIYFGAVAYYVLIDTIRTTTSGTEQPPPLMWSPTKLVGALGGYAALLGFYALLILALFQIKNGSLPASAEDFAALSDPVSLIVLALLTFGVPMNMIGLSSSQSMDGLNPVRVAPSIGRTIGHYTFLFLIVVLYLGFYVGVMYAVMSWAGPMIMGAASRDTEAGLAKIMLKVLAGLGAWSILIGAAFYFAYSIGRILGLFSRTYRKLLAFEL